MNVTKESDQHPPSIDIWVLEHDYPAPTGILERCREVTSESERRAAGRFLEPSHREQALMTRGLLRLALSHRMGGPAEDWRFVSSPRGRPRVVLPDGGGSIDFNISHTRGCIVCAISGLARIGIDVEALECADEIRSVIDEFLSAAEARLIRTMSAHQGAAVLVRLWTVKEALAKGIGIGLGLPMKKICFASSLADHPHSLETLAAGKWRIRTIKTGSGRYLLSLVTRNFDTADEIILRDSRDLLAS
jgi:4'-phosphopantetheinyl transferase